MNSREDFAAAGRNRLIGVRRAREVFLGVLHGFAPGELLWSPGTSMWSGLQVLEHVVRAEREMLASPGTSLPEGAHRRTFKDRMLYAVVVAALRLNLRVPVVSAGMEPRGEMTPEVLEAAWAENLEHLERYLEQASPSDLDAARFRHPVAGALDLGRALRVDELHIRAHVRELRRNRALLASSGCR